MWYNSWRFAEVGEMPKAEGMNKSSESNCGAFEQGAAVSGFADLRVFVVCTDKVK